MTDLFYFAYVYPFKPWHTLFAASQKPARTLSPSMKLIFLKWFVVALLIDRVFMTDGRFNPKTPSL